MLRTMEKDSTPAIPILAYGALPTIDEAAKIALLFANEGRFEGRQILSQEKVREVFGKAGATGHSTNNDYRGAAYRHGFWSKPVKRKDAKHEQPTCWVLGKTTWFFSPAAASFSGFWTNTTWTSLS